VAVAAALFVISRLHIAAEIRAINFHVAADFFAVYFRAKGFAELVSEHESRSMRCQSGSAFHIPTINSKLRAHWSQRLSESYLFALGAFAT